MSSLVHPKKALQLNVFTVCKNVNTLLKHIQFFAVQR